MTFAQQLVLATLWLLGSFPVAWIVVGVMIWATEGRKRRRR